jgi:hypothetical protein
LKVGHPKIISTHFWAKEISIFSNSSHFEWRAGLSDTILLRNELKWSLGGPLSKLCVTPPFSINFRFQIKSQVSDFRPLWASSFRIQQAGLSDTILKGDHPRTIPAKFALIWFSSFREDLNVIFYQNMSNLYNRLKEKFTEKPRIYVNLLIVM